MTELPEHIAEYEYDFKMCLGDGYPDIFIEVEPDMGVDMYVDQSPNHSKFYDREFSAIYLETGLRRMESWMCHQIINGSKYTKDELTKMIRRNPHLHNMIKTNLLDNLTNSKLWN